MADYLVLLAVIECKKLNDHDDDDIYYQLDGADQRPSGEDYWNFDGVGKRHFPNTVVLAGGEGTTVKVTLCVHHGILTRTTHDEMGQAELTVGDGALTIDETSGTTYLGLRDGNHAVEFHDANGVYTLHFAARTVQTI